MNYKEHARKEFQIAGWLTINEDGTETWCDSMQKEMCEHVMLLLDVFHNGGHSGSSAPYALNLFKNLAMFNPLTPLTGEDYEWVNVSDVVGEELYQNKRDSEIFKENGQAYTICGKVFWNWYQSDGDNEPSKTYYTSRDSRVNITFPYTKPESPEYIFVPTTEFPDEIPDVLNKK